jgi:hypothetical protein
MMIRRGLEQRRRAAMLVHLGGAARATMEWPQLRTDAIVALLERIRNPETARLIRR